MPPACARIAEAAAPRIMTPIQAPPLDCVRPCAERNDRHARRVRERNGANARPVPDGWDDGAAATRRGTARNEARQESPNGRIDGRRHAQTVARCGRGHGRRRFHSSTTRLITNSVASRRVPWSSRFYFWAPYRDRDRARARPSLFRSLHSPRYASSRVVAIAAAAAAGQVKISNEATKRARVRPRRRASNQRIQKAALVKVRSDATPRRLPRR